MWVSLAVSSFLIFFLLRSPPCQQAPKEAAADTHPVTISANLKCFVTLSVVIAHNPNYLQRFKVLSEVSLESFSTICDLIGDFLVVFTPSISISFSFFLI
ncbi:hypothetical protein XENOCAPTIV_010270 [Xenoophorus captivus]|uniref:Uncharacterized protein n=1 Tax=Xenoophorus captivus TaxID=1517983 RepID=A0ABV0QR35_9TELE